MRIPKPGEPCDGEGFLERAGTASKTRGRGGGVGFDATLGGREPMTWRPTTTVWCPPTLFLDQCTMDTAGRDKLYQAWCLESICTPRKLALRGHSGGDAKKSGEPCHLTARRDATGGELGWLFVWCLCVDGVGSLAVATPQTDQAEGGKRCEEMQRGGGERGHSADGWEVWLTWRGDGCLRRGCFLKMDGYKVDVQSRVSGVG